MLKKVIIVEDDVFLQDFYRIFFKRFGAEVLIMEDVDEILRELHIGNVDLIILDINLRNMMLFSKRIDGIMLSQHIKKNYAHLKVPILLVTAYPLNGFGDPLLEKSMADDYLLKPIADYNKLVEKINKLVFGQNER